MIMRRPPALALTMLLAAAQPTLSASGADIPWSLDVAPQSVVQGQTVRVRIRGMSAGTAVRLTVGSARVRLHPVAGGFEAFVGTSPLTAPGPLTIRARVLNNNGVVARTHQIRVRAGTFGTRRLSVPPALLDPALVAIERRRVAQALAAPLPTPLWRGVFRLPVDGPVTSGYGVRSVYNGVPRGYHWGVDFRGVTGTPVHAAASGVVTLAERLPLSGNIVMLDHGGGIFTTYQHLSAIAVSRGGQVGRGKIIGRVGSTGLSTGPHLHWGMRVGGVRVNPLYWTTDGPLTAP
jgi:murein DD-endopeptidase MepM/ murein hydrolase activator NlpD